jgi:hypothetical protein
MYNKCLSGKSRINPKIIKPGPQYRLLEMVKGDCMCKTARINVELCNITGISRFRDRGRVGRYPRVVRQTGEIG